MASVNPLNIALTGLKVAQSQIAVTSNNVANVSTEGYTRKTVQQYSTVLGDDPTGVETGVIRRTIDEILLRDYRTQISSTSALETRAKYLDQIQDFHGPPDSEQSITAFMDQLKAAFAQLSNQPESPYLLTAVYSKAEQLVEKFSGFSDRLQEMRNNAQSTISESVSKINTLTRQIADLNLSIKVATTQGRTTAALEDQRDEAVKALAQEMDISYFKTPEGVLVVQTKEGQALADTSPISVTFNQVPVGPGSYYPVSANPVMLGHPVTGINLSDIDTLGGRLGELIRLRDETLPTYQAQADELAHKMAMRFSSQGLDLFTMPDGTIPANTPTSYVGFSTDMVINPSITTDKTLIRKGTSTASTVQQGSSELLRKIVEFTFGSVEYQRAQGTVNISNTVPTLFTTLGITGQARVVGTTNISALGSLDSSPYINPPTDDDFTIQVGVGAPQTIVITAGMNASGLVSAINTAFPGMAQLGSGGELILSATDNITIGAGTLLTAGLSELGLTAGVTTASPPSFSISAGQNTPSTIQILSTDTTTQLLSKLNAVAGITATLTVGGFLNIEPTEGGDLSLTDGIGAPLQALGVTVADVPHASFNVNNLGPGANLGGEVSGALTLQNYVSQMVSLQSQEANNTDTLFTSEDNYRAVIQTEYMSVTGVNVDEEMANLINIQAAYNAASRTIQVANEMLNELMNTFIR
ncbi:MAG: flagellar hook-associated protein FlgK [Proteobacteria bacterium]|nr:flagellar hook-associated protein FlgK [Pseudomonadota bacterium]